MKIVKRMGRLAGFGYPTIQRSADGLVRAGGGCGFARTGLSALLLGGLLFPGGQALAAARAAMTNVTATAQPTASVPASITPAVAAVLRLAESGVTDEVLIGYIKNIQTPFSLSADTILYLKDLGLSSPVITAMLNRDSELHALAPIPAPMPPTSPPPAEVVAPGYDTNAPTDASSFYSSLYPYGSWAVVDGIGWCWQPRCWAINHNWRPYCDGGNWVYTDCGWYWQSGYSWGWAPFHYGRWAFQDRCGWVWCPDRTWGPAWVSWRTAGNSCGWAPLPPSTLFIAGRSTPLQPSSIYVGGSGWIYNGTSVGTGHDFGLRPEAFTFVSMNDVTARDLPQRRMSTVEVRSVFDHSTIINNTTVGKNNILVNQGVPVQRVAAATHSQIPQAIIHDQPPSSLLVANTPFSERNSAVVYRHQAPPATKPVKAVAQKVDAQHPLVQHQLVPTRMAYHSQTSAAAPLPGNNYRTTTVPPQAMTPVPRYDNSALATSQAQPSPSQNYMPHVYYPKGHQQAGSTQPMAQSAGPVGRSFAPQMVAPGQLK